MGTHFCAHAQQFIPKWVNDLGTASGNATVSDVTVDKQNNIYIIGSFGPGSVDFDPGPGVKNLQTGGTDLFVGKYKQDGTLIWVEPFPAAPNIGNLAFTSLAVDKDGNISITGEFAGGTQNFDPGSGVYNLVAHGQDGFVVHLDNNGGFLWAHSTGGSSYDGGIVVAADSQDNVIVTSSFGSSFTIGNSTYTAPPGVHYGMIAKYDPAGNVVWTVALGANNANEIAMGCRVDSQDNIIVSGLFNNTVNFNPLGSSVNLTASIADESFVAKYSPSGNLIWINAVGAISPLGNPLNHSLINIDQSDNVYFAESFRQSATFNSSFTLNAKGAQDICFAKYSPGGVLQYAKSFGGPSTPVLQSSARCFKMVSDKNDNIYITGYFDGTINFNPNPGNPENLSVPVFGFNFYVAEYDTNGNYIIAFSGGDPVCGMSGFGLAVDGSGNIDYGGYFCSTVNFDPTGCTTDNVTAISTNYHDGFIVQYSPLAISNNTITAPVVAAFCTSGTPAAITGSTPLGGAGTYGYQWQSSTDSLNFTDIPGATSVDYTPAVVTATTFYRRVVSIKCAPSVASNAVGLQVVQPLAAPVVTVDSTTASSVTFKWTAVAGATGYQISTDGGQTFSAPSSGATGLTHTVTGLQDDQSVTLIVEAIGSQACQMSTASVTGRALNLKNDIIYVPNALTPNGTDKNNQVHVHSENIKSLKFYVYDQWGELLFTSNDVKDGWDGTFKGKKEPVGVYVYYLSAIMNDGHTVNKKGTITLLR